jgi:hypothetical protein
MAAAVMPVPELVPLYWGTFSQVEVDKLPNCLVHFAGDLNGADAGRDEEPVVRQYGVNGAAAVRTATVQPLANAAQTSAADADALAAIQSLQPNNKLPAFDPCRLFMLDQGSISVANKI